MNLRKLLPVLSLLVFIACTTHVFGQTTAVYQIKADSLLNNKDFKQALDNYNLAIKKSDVSDKKRLSVLHFECALCQEGLSQFKDALKSYSTAIELDPHFRNAYWNRGVLYENTGSYLLAIGDYNDAIANSQADDTGTEILYTNVAYNEFKLGNFDKALQADSMATAVNPRYGRAYDIKGEIYINQNNFELAAESYSLAIFNYGDNINKPILSYLYQSRGYARMRAKSYKDAINDFSYAILLKPDNGIAFWNRGAAYFNNGDYSLAADDYTKAISFYQDAESLSKLYDNRASNEIGLTLFDKALQDDSTALALNPSNTNALIGKARAYTQEGNYEQGVDCYKKSLDLMKDDKKRSARVYYEIANGEYFLNEFDKVIADCTMAISLDPDFSESYYYRAKVYFKKINNKTLANADFNKVLALDTTKRSVGYVFSLLYLGRTDEAIGILQNDLLNAKNNEVTMGDYYNLACLYSLANQPDEANIYLKKAIDNGYSKKYAIADEDLDNIRNTDDYKSIIAP